MLTNLIAMNWGRTAFAIADRDELLVFDRKSLEPVWQRKLPANIVGLDSINDGLIMVLDERGEITHWDWQSGEANGGLSLGIRATGSSATIHGIVAVSTVSSVVIIVDCQIVTTIPIPDLTALHWSPNGESLAIGSQKGELVIYRRSDLHQLVDPKPTATMLFEKMISAIAWAGYDRDSGFDYWDILVGDKIWGVNSIAGDRRLGLQSLPSDIYQFACLFPPWPLWAVAHGSRVVVYSACSSVITERTPTTIQYRRNTNLAVPDERNQLVIAEIDYGDRFVTGLRFVTGRHFDYNRQLLVCLDQGEANLVNLVEEQLFRTVPFPGRPAINLTFNAEFHSDNIPGLERLPEIDVNAEPKLTSAERRNRMIARFRWWASPLAGIVMGGIYLSDKAPQDAAILQIIISIALGLAASLLFCIVDFIFDGQ